MIHPSRLNVLACASLLLTFAASVDALSPQRTFVSTGGNDANPCSLTLPCRGFAAAVTAVAAGGEVIVLDSGGYGAVTIGKSVTIAAPGGVYAGISVTSGNGVTISAGASDVVALRNLTIVGLGGTDGIVAASVGELRVEGLHVSGFGPGPGMYGLQFATAGALTVASSTLEGNYIGIEIGPPAASTITVVVTDTQLTRNVAGYRQVGPGTANATITRTNASANSQDGFIVNTAAGRLVLESCVVSENLVLGVYIGTGVLVLSGNTITGNGTGVTVLGGATGQTRGNNTIVQNAPDVAGTLTPIPGGGT